MNNNGNNLFGPEAQPRGELTLVEGDEAAFLEEFRERHTTLAEPVAPPPGPEQIIDGLSHEEAEQLAGEPEAIQMPVVNLNLGGADMRIVRQPGSGERAMVVGPIVFNLLLPFDEEGARATARELTGGIEIASSLPGGSGLASALRERMTLPE